MRRLELEAAVIKGRKSHGLLHCYGLVSPGVSEKYPVARIVGCID